jgi:hypothetical protein
MRSDWYLDRDEQEAVELGQRIYDNLKWFFSDECLKVNRAAYGPTGNRWAYINAYADHYEGKYMVWDGLSNYKRGCSFWGLIRKEVWQSKSSGAQKIWSLNKAKEILHLNK